MRAGHVFGPAPLDPGIDAVPVVDFMVPPFDVDIVPPVVLTVAAGFFVFHFDHLEISMMRDFDGMQCRCLSRLEPKYTGRQTNRQLVTI